MKDIIIAVLKYFGVRHTRAFVTNLFLVSYIR